MFSSFNKIKKRKAPDKLQLISDSIASMPQPQFSLGEIVMVPPGTAGVVGLISANWEDMVWCYGVFCSSNPEKIHWFGEAMVIKLAR
jgi:hypothetical protein